MNINSGTNINPGIIRKLFVGLGCVAVVLIYGFVELPDNKFHIYFLDVGQGDSIFIKTPENHQILVDGGSEDFVIGELGEVMPFFDKTIDLIVLTHPHADHVDGLVEVVKRYKVTAVLITGVYDDYSGYEEFLRIVREQGVEIFLAQGNEDFLFGRIYFDILYPFNSIAGEKFKNLNNSSIVMKVTNGENEILLTGDAEEEVESELVESNLNLSANILKAGHHGSRTASSMDFLKKVLPEYVVIQCGEGNTFNHPHSETLRNFYRIEVRRIFRNDEDGRVEF